MEYGYLLKSSMFAGARLAAALAVSVALFAGAVSADPRPGTPPNPGPAGPSLEAMRGQFALHSRAVKIGPARPQNPLFSSSGMKVPCAACSYHPPLLAHR